MKTKTLAISALAGAALIGAAALSASPSMAHGSQSYGGQGHMMGQGGQMGQTGMMGQGGHMSQGGQMGHMGMKGRGLGHMLAGRDFTVDQIRTLLEAHLIMRGNDRLKVGAIEKKDDGAITAEIVTVDDSLVRKLEFNPKAGMKKKAE